MLPHGMCGRCLDVKTDLQRQARYSREVLSWLPNDSVLWRGVRMCPGQVVSDGVLIENAG